MRMASFDEAVRAAISGRKIKRPSFHHWIYIRNSDKSLCIDSCYWGEMVRELTDEDKLATDWKIEK